MYSKILNEIKKYDTIIIHRHHNPDGDAIGSQTGLKLILSDSFPNKRVYAVGDAPGRYSFIEGSEPDQIEDSLYSNALAIILDSGSSAMVSDERYTLAPSTVRFDHHVFCEQVAQLEVVDTTYESCCGLVTDFANSCGLTVSDRAAQALYTGMVTDSGRFRYDCVTAKTFTLAAFLAEHSIDTEKLFSFLYSEDLEAKKQRAAFTLKIRLTKNGVAYIINTLEECRSSGLDNFTISRGMVGTMADIKGVPIWVNFTETETGVLCELRSNAFNINPIAVKYGGGGHKKASGATVDGLDTALLMLEDLDRLASEG